MFGTINEVQKMTLLDPAIVKLATATFLTISALPTAEEQTALLKRHIEASHVFVGIVPESSGARQILIKGQKLLEDIEASGEPPALIRDAILVSRDEEAIAMRDVFGDGTKRHWLH